jgi:hypothetical protein
VSCKWVKSFWAVQAGIILILQTNVVGLAYFIPIRIPKGFVVIHNSLTQQRWTLFMTDSKGTFIGMVRATPEKFQFSIKVPETITHVKRLDVNKGAMIFSSNFLIKYLP